MRLIMGGKMSEKYAVIRGDWPPDKKSVVKLNLSREDAHATTDALEKKDHSSIYWAEYQPASLNPLELLKHLLRGNNE